MGPPQSRSLALWGEEVQRNERAFAIGGSEGYGACADEAGGLATSPKGGEHMPITLTFHVRGLTVTVQVKRDNRHSAK